MNRLDLLSDLQAIDMRIEEHVRARAEVEARLADDASLVAVQQALVVATNRVNEMRARLRSLDLEVNGIGDKIKAVDNRLYGGRISNPKELSGLEQDELMLKRRKTEVEDQMLEAMAQLETAEAALTAQTAARDKISAERATLAARDHAKLDDLKSADDKLLNAREQLCAQIESADLTLYDSLRREKKGRAVARMRGAACEVCGFSVPSGLASRVRVAQELSFCSNCGRILVP